VALNQKTLQKKRAKKAEKRKQAKPAGNPDTLAHFQSLWRAVAGEAAVADAWVPSNLFEVGLGTVWLTRRMADGSYAVAGFLVDVYCLGVKNALYNLIEDYKYAPLLADLRSNLSRSGGMLLPVEPAHVRKLVESAADYAESLGFRPHPDYKLTRLIFGDIDPASCPTQFVFGRDGKPLYIPGAEESPAAHRQVLATLERHCGPQGYRLVTEV